MILVTTGSCTFNASSVTYHGTDRALVEVRKTEDEVEAYQKWLDKI